MRILRLERFDLQFDIQITTGHGRIEPHHVGWLYTPFPFKPRDRSFDEASQAAKDWSHHVSPGGSMLDVGHPCACTIRWVGGAYHYRLHSTIGVSHGRDNPFQIRRVGYAMKVGARHARQIRPLA